MAESPFKSSWKYMFGWEKSKEGETLEEIMAVVTYDTRPETLREQVAVSINLSIWRVISGYVSAAPGPITFEIWKNVDDEIINANWYGQMTYGTCWFRGSKIWLTPEAGTTMNVPRGEPGEDHVCLQAYNHWKRRKVLENRYDTSQLPFRMDSPRELVDSMKGEIWPNMRPNVAFNEKKQMRTTMGINHEWKPLGEFDPEDNWGTPFGFFYTWRRREAAAYKLWNLMGRKALVFIHPGEGSSFSGREGGTPNIYLIRSATVQEKLFQELEFVQSTGERSHGVRFSWM